MLGDANCLNCGMFMLYVDARLVGEQRCANCRWRNFFYLSNLPSRCVPPDSSELAPTSGTIETQGSVPQAHAAGEECPVESQG